MIRTQVQLSETQLRALRQLSSASGKSIAELIRQGVDLFLQSQRQVSREERTARALAVAGRFASSSPDGGTRHDRHLADAFRQ